MFTGVVTGDDEVFGSGLGLVLDTTVCPREASGARIVELRLIESFAARSGEM